MAGEVPSAETIPTLHRRIFAESAALREVAGRVGEGGVTTAGRAAGSAGAFLLASLGGSTARPILLVTSSLDEAERARRDWSTFLGGPVETFPPWESLFEEGSEPDPEIFRQRTEVLDGLLQRKLAGAVAPMQALLQPVARSADARDRRILLRSGDSFPPEELARALVHAGYRRFPQVARPGDFSIRGGIFDIHPRESSHPYRLDYFGDEIDSIRTVSAVDLRSRDDVSLLVLTLLPRSDYFIRGFTGGEVTLLDRLPGDTVLAIASPREVEERCISLIGQWAPRRDKPLASELWARGAHLTRLHLEPLVPEPAHRPVMLPAGSVQGFTGNLERSLAALAEETARGTEARVYFRGEAEAERFREILDEAGIGDGCEILLGDLSSGFRWQEPVGGTFLPGSALLGRSGMLARRARRGVAPARAVDSFLELEAGDHVVHVAHGIGRFLGVRHLQKGRRRGDHLVIEYRDGVHLLVPAERIDLVQKYVGGGVAPARLDRLGGSAWARRRARVEDGLHDLAADMLEVQALRAEREGFAFPADTDWQREFEAAFPFEETPDQLSSAASIRVDLESPRPMDRLICGDVGYGKTELAMRAAFKVVEAGRQVAVLVPTTVLAQQHLVTFRDRVAEFPVRVEALSRFRSRKEQTEILRRAGDGEIDILIGTHRLLSSDVSFANLGLIVIDEEQRFGVAHKERLKHLRRMVDILTLTATPIPRTLHLALIGARDISSLADPPQGRNPIHTEVCAFEEERFREIILRELNRDGQVFFLHNRVQTIKARRTDLERLVPEASIIEVHGQMKEGELEKRMLGFLEKRYNVLVTTTIIESGLDIPSANTLVVDRADRFGLAELHQLRGRVGRGTHRAYAYLLIPPDRPMTADARSRLAAIEEYSQLGAGFQIALRDLEIRGAGNILGKEQSGHITTIGYDLYCRLLERAIAALKGSPVREPPDVEIAIPGLTRIPEGYIPDATARLRTYRAIATSLDEESVEEIEEGLIDRYGEPPAETRALLALQLLRITLGRWGARRASIEDGWLILEGDSAAMLDALEELAWERVRLHDGHIGARPRGHPLAEDLGAVAGALGILCSSAIPGS